MAVRITTLAAVNSGNNDKIYVAYSWNDCKGATDLEVFKLVMETKDSITMGKVIGEHISTSTFTDLKWSGTGDVPAIGTPVIVGMNGLGHGTVRSYFAEEGWLGVMVKLDSPPNWYVRQNGAEAPAHIFGLELGEPDTVTVQRGAFDLARAFIGMHTGDGVPADLFGIFSEEDLTDTNAILETLEGSFS